MSGLHVRSVSLITIVLIFATSGCSSAQRSVSASGKNVPIRFWGKVVDEEDVPMEGVRVRAEARHFGPGFTDSRPHRDTVTDKDGRFEISGLSGDLLTIRSLQMDGYEAEPSALRWFGYNISTNYIPDPNHPAILRMWRTNTHERLIISLPYNNRYRIVPNGSIHTVDLSTGKNSTNAAAAGDLRIWVRRPENVSDMTGQKWDWRADIEMIDGGFHAETDPLMWMVHAPSDGYTNRLHFEHFASEERWSSVEWNKQYYFLSHGKYGKMELAVSSYCTSDGRAFACLFVNWAMNPSGSRTLK